MSALLAHPPHYTLPASSRASHACLILACYAVCVFPPHNMRTCVGQCLSNDAARGAASHEGAPCVRIMITLPSELACRVRAANARALRTNASARFVLDTARVLVEWCESEAGGCSTHEPPAPSGDALDKKATERATKRSAAREPVKSAFARSHPGGRHRLPRAATHLLGGCRSCARARVTTAPISLSLTIQVRRNETYAKKQKVRTLVVTRDSVPGLKWREIERLLASGQLSRTVSTRFSNEPGAPRRRRPREAVCADVQLAWPASQEAITISGAGEDDE